MAKRGQGEGSISKRPDGTWWARITVGKTPDGKQKRKAFYGKTRKEVQEKLTKALNDINNNTYIEPSKMTLASWMDIWLKEYKNTVKPSTFFMRYAANQKYISRMLGNYKLKDLRQGHIQKFVNDLTEMGLSTNYVLGICVPLHGALEKAVSREMIYKNPMKDIDYPKRVRKEREVLTEEEQKRFVEVAQYTVHGKMYILMLGTGIRLGEALPLTWDDVDFENRLLSINKTITKVKDPYDKESKFWGVGSPKTEKSRRIIPLLPSLVDMLNGIKEDQACNKEKYKAAYQDNRLIFCYKTGEGFSERRSIDRLQEILTAIGITRDRKITPHNLRHTFATRGLEKGIDLKVMQELLGHSSFSMTADLYTHVLEDKKADSIAKLDDTINP